MNNDYMALIILILVMTVTLLIINHYSKSGKMERTLTDEEEKIENKYDEEYWRTHDKNEPDDE